MLLLEQKAGERWELFSSLLDLIPKGKVHRLPKVLALLTHRGCSGWILGTISSLKEY